MADTLLTQPTTDASTPALLSPSRFVARMTNPQRPSDGPFGPPRELNRQSWAWLDSLGRSLGCAVLLVDQNGTQGPLIGATTIANELRSLLNAGDDPSMPSSG